MIKKKNTDTLKEQIQPEYSIVSRRAVLKSLEILFRVEEIAQEEGLNVTELFKNVTEQKLLPDLVIKRRK